MIGTPGARPRTGRNVRGTPVGAGQGGRRPWPPPPRAHDPEGGDVAGDDEVEVDIPVDAGGDGTDRRRITGSLVLPHATPALVMFAHGSGSSRLSPRNAYVAERLQDAGLGTLLLDLLTPGEERRDAVSGHLRFDIGLLARRLVAPPHWVTSQEPLRSLRIGYFGASTGAAAALVAAAARPSIGAIVS